MKKLIVVLLVIGIIACKKEELAPVSLFSIEIPVDIYDTNYLYIAKYYNGINLDSITVLKYNDSIVYRLNLTYYDTIVTYYNPQYLAFRQLNYNQSLKYFNYNDLPNSYYEYKVIDSNYRTLIPLKNLKYKDPM